jgi:hypothetical protein
MHVSQQRQPPGRLPNYHCRIANISSDWPEQKFGTLLKLKNAQRLLRLEGK